jgi:heme/copper-type cytochrome/quinol oxidase subunit 4
MLLHMKMLLHMREAERHQPNQKLAMCEVQVSSFYLKLSLFVMYL